MLVALDSNVLIAALVGRETYSQQAQQLVRSIAGAKHEAILSSIAYGEVLNVTSGKRELFLEEFITQINYIKTIAASDAICLLAGQLRVQYGPSLKLPDALHLATALTAKAKVFITDDKQLAKFANAIIPCRNLADLGNDFI